MSKADHIVVSDGYPSDLEGFRRLKQTYRASLLIDLSGGADVREGSECSVLHLVTHVNRQWYIDNYPADTVVLYGIGTPGLVHSNIVLATDETLDPMLQAVVSLILGT